MEIDSKSHESKVFLMGLMDMLEQVNSFRHVIYCSLVTLILYVRTYASNRLDLSLEILINISFPHIPVHPSQN